MYIHYFAVRHFEVTLKFEFSCEFSIVKPTKRQAWSKDSDQHVHPCSLLESSLNV